MSRLDTAAAEAHAERRIRLLLTAAYECQWRTPGATSASDDVARRSKGGHSDPTPEVALDERRLALRHAVRHAEAALRLPWLFNLDAAEAGLREALAPYGEA